MPIRDMDWKDGEGYDIHLLRGNHRLNVRDGLEFTRPNGSTVDAATYLASNADVTLEFFPSFKHTVDVTTTPPQCTGFGIRIDTETGTVEVDAPPTPDPVIHNFILHARAEDSSDGKTYETTIRVHLHNKVMSAWLTPPVLTVRPTGRPRPEQTEVRFSVRALFDDDTVGDITHHPNIIWRPTANFNGIGEITIDTGNNASTPPIDVEAVLPPDLEDFLSPSPPEIKATGQIRFADAWSDEAPIVAETVQIQDTWPGTINPEVVPNFLFLCDGYKAEDQPAFEAQVRSLLGLMKRSQITRPFDILSTSMNYFRAFVPSDNHGISVLCEVYPNQDSSGNIETESDGTVRLFVYPDPEKPSGDGNWGLANVIYTVGLPVPAQAGLDVGDIRDYWDEIVDGIDRDKISASTVKYWRKLAKRTFLEEVDTVFGLAYGEYPSASEKSNTLMVGFHPYRMKRSDRETIGSDTFVGGIDPFLSRLVDGNGISMGDVWAQPTTGSRPNSHPLVFFLSSARWDRGVNYGRGYIAMNVEQRRWIPGRPVTGKPTYQVDLTGKITHDITHSRLIRGCHEIAHSFGLGDEYNEKGEMPQTQTIDAFYGNLQKHSDIEDPATNQLDGDRIKWRWPRIHKAAVLSGAITPSGSGFKIPLVLGQANQFAVGNQVLLRKRDFPDPLPLDPGTRNGLISDLLEIKQVTDATDQTAGGTPEAFIVVEAASGHTFNNADAAEFPEGSIVYLPVKARDSVFNATTYPYSELIAKNIKDHITARNRALNIDPDRAEMCVHDPNDIQNPVKLTVDLPFCYKNKNRIVGLFTGGRGFDCGVYHPTGSCIMRNSDDDGKEFCAVCRYILVDIIDPYKHFLIDRDYEEIYPQT